MTQNKNFSLTCFGYRLWSGLIDLRWFAMKSSTSHDDIVVAGEGINILEIAPFPIT